MQMTSSVVVKSDLESAWTFLADERNAPRWDRSVARADLASDPPLRVGSIVRTTAPSGMQQEFRVDEISAPHRLGFSLVRSSWFRTAQLTFTLAPVENAVRITHEIAVTSGSRGRSSCPSSPSSTGAPSRRIWTRSAARSTKGTT
jgi:hypothetical protein